LPRVPKQTRFVVGLLGCPGGFRACRPILRLIAMRGAGCAARVPRCCRPGLCLGTVWSPPPGADPGTVWLPLPDGRRTSFQPWLHVRAQICDEFAVLVQACVYVPTHDDANIIRVSWPVSSKINEVARPKVQLLRIGRCVLRPGGWPQAWQFSRVFFPLGACVSSRCFKVRRSPLVFRRCCG